MKIKELVKELKYEVLAGNEEAEVTTLVCDSRKVEKGSVFVCISGSVRDAHEFRFRRPKTRGFQARLSCRLYPLSPRRRSLNPWQSQLFLSASSADSRGLKMIVSS